MVLDMAVEFWCFSKASTVDFMSVAERLVRTADWSGQVPANIVPLCVMIHSGREAALQTRSALEGNGGWLSP